MKKIILLMLIGFFGISAYSQTTMEAIGVKPENACDPDNVYFLTKDRPSLEEKIDDIEKRLNEEVDFAKNNPDFNATAALQFAVNCKGEVGGGFHYIKSTGNEKLDQELIDFFKTVGNWAPGKLKRKNVDCWYMWRMKIEDGKIDILNE